MRSLDYLMAVASTEHSARNTKFRNAFPEMGALEESVVECFARIRTRREQRTPPRKALRRMMLPLALLGAAAALMAHTGAAALLLAQVLASPPPPPPPPPSWWDSVYSAAFGS